jgi:hypothetical protein
MMMLVRSCIRCGAEFKQVHRRGRPRSICFGCCPAGRELDRRRSGTERLRSRRRFESPAEPAA